MIGLHPTSVDDYEKELEMLWPEYLSIPNDMCNWVEWIFVLG